uniref:Uncharacterized protein n=1 Tax=Physcomitrium patens TaxID=3218 RepID=A0A2K1LBA7_PHYPA|nr:hypothetical protein PHYPA_001728 [Physcomitrium patens]
MQQSKPTRHGRRQDGNERMIRRGRDFSAFIELLRDVKFLGLEDLAIVPRGATTQRNPNPHFS